MKLRKLCSLLLAAVISITALVGCSLGKETTHDLYDISYSLPQKYEWEYFGSNFVRYAIPDEDDFKLLITSYYFPDSWLEDMDYQSIYQTSIFSTLSDFTITETMSAECANGYTGRFTANINDHTSDSGISYSKCHGGIKITGNIVTAVTMLSDSDHDKEFLNIYDSIRPRESYNDDYNQTDSGIVYRIPDSCTGENGTFTTEQGQEIKVKVFEDVEIKSTQADNYLYLLTDLYENNFADIWDNSSYESENGHLMPMFQLRNRIGIRDQGTLEDGRYYCSSLIRVSESTYVMVSVAGDGTEIINRLGMLDYVTDITLSIRPEPAQ